MKFRSPFRNALAVILVALSGCMNPDSPSSAVQPAPVPTAPPTTPVKEVKPNDPNEVMATLNGVHFIRKEIDARVSAVMVSQKIPEGQAAEARKFFEQRIISSMILRCLLLDEVKKSGLTVTAEESKNHLERLASQLKPRNMTVEQYFKQNPLGEVEARKEFNEGMLIDKLLETKRRTTWVETDDQAVKMRKSQEAIQTYIQELKKAATITTPAFPDMQP